MTDPKKVNTPEPKDESSTLKAKEENTNLVTSNEDPTVEIERLKSVIQGLEKKQSEERKQYNEMSSKFEAVEVEFDTLKKELSAKGVDINNLKELENINEMKQKHERFQKAIDIASELGLPTELAKRIQGTTEEEMKKDAESLKGFVNPAQPDFKKVKKDEKKPSEIKENQVTPKDLIELYKG